MTNEEWAAIERPYRLAIKERLGMLITTTEAAKRLGYSAKWFLRTYVQPGKVPAVKIGGRWLIDEADLAALPPKSKRGRPRRKE